MSKTTKDNHTAYLNVITIGESRRGIELNRDRGDQLQVNLLEAWLGEVTIG